MWGPAEQMLQQSFWHSYRNILCVQWEVSFSVSACFPHALSFLLAPGCIKIMCLYSFLCFTSSSFSVGNALPFPSPRGMFECKPLLTMTCGLPLTGRQLERFMRVCRCRCGPGTWGKFTFLNLYLNRMCVFFALNVSPDWHMSSITVPLVNPLFSKWTRFMLSHCK